MPRATQSGLRKALLAVALLALSCYVALCLVMYARQRTLMYLPQLTRAASAGTDFSLAVGGATLRGWVVNPGRPRAMLYFGGNAEAIERNRGDFERWFPGTTVYLLAYRGYGASDGEPRQDLLFEDALALYDHVRARQPAAPIDVLGRSLGTGVASYVASRRPVRRMALVTPFDSMVEVAQARYGWLPVRLLLEDRYESRRYLARFTRPLLVVRAGRDQVIGWDRTQALIDALPRPPRVLELPGAGHGSVREDPAYAAALKDFFG